MRVRQWTGQAEIRDAIPNDERSKKDINTIDNFFVNLFERQSEQIDQHYPENTTDEISETDWKEDLKIPDEYFTHWYKFISLLTLFETIWDSRLGFTKSVQHRTEL